MGKRPVEILDLPVDDRAGRAACHFLIRRHDFQMGRADLQIVEIEGVQPAPFGARKGPVVPGKSGLHIGDMHQNGRHKIGHRNTSPTQIIIPRRRRRPLEEAGLIHRFA
ncbi:hypothetical protein D3C87_1736980 [compost metagenome]